MRYNCCAKMGNTCSVPPKTASNVVYQLWPIDFFETSLGHMIRFSSRGNFLKAKFESRPRGRGCQSVHCNTTILLMCIWHCHHVTINSYTNAGYPSKPLFLIDGCTFQRDDCFSRLSPDFVSLGIWKKHSTKCQRRYIFFSP